MNTTLSMNLRHSGVGQYIGFIYESAISFGDGTLVGGANGLFLVSGSSDDGSDIDASFELPLSDHGAYQHKHVRAAYASYESDGAVNVTFEFDESDTKTFTAQLSSTSGASQHGRLSGNRDHAGRHLKVIVANTAGCSMAIDALDAYLIYNTAGEF